MYVSSNDIFYGTSHAAQSDVDIPILKCRSIGETAVVGTIQTVC